MAFKIELKDDEVALIVEALRIQLEKWDRVQIEGLPQDPDRNRTLVQATNMVQRYQELLKRFPDARLAL